MVQAKTEKELGNACLSVALEITGSCIGFVGEIGTDEIMHDIAISESGWNQCLMYDKTGHRCCPGDLFVHGLYGSIINSREENKNESCKSTSYTLTVSDNGIGIPENLDIENLNTLGFQLIASLVEQLDGEFKLKRSNGTEFDMRFTVAEEKMNKHQLQH